MEYRLIEIDLTENSINQSLIPVEMITKFLGGRGLNSWFIQKKIPEGVKPYDPDNIIAMSCGLLSEIAARRGFMDIGVTAQGKS